MKKFSAKKVVTVLAAFSLCFTMVPFAAFAQEGPVTEEAAMAMENETLQIEEVKEEAIEAEVINEEAEIKISENEVNEEVTIEEPAAEEAEAEEISEPAGAKTVLAVEESENMVMQAVAPEDEAATELPEEEVIDAVTVLDGQTYYMTINGWYLKTGSDEKMRTTSPESPSGIVWTFIAAGTGDEEYKIHQNGSYLASNGSRWITVKDESQAGIFCVENEGGRYNIREKDTQNYIGAGNDGSAKPNYFSVFRAKGEGTGFIFKNNVKRSIDFNGREYVIYTKASDGNCYAIMVDDMEGNPTMRAAKKVNVERSNGQDYIYVDGEEEAPTVWTFEYAAGSFKHNLSTVKDGAKKYLFAPKANNTQLVLDNEGRGFNLVPRGDGSYRLVGSNYTLQGPNCPEYSNGGFKAGGTVANENEWFRFAKLVVKEEPAEVIEEPEVQDETDPEETEETIVPEEDQKESDIPETVEETKEEAAEAREAEVIEEVAEVKETEVIEEVAEVKETEVKEEVKEEAKASEEITVNTVAETIEDNAQPLAAIVEEAQVEAIIDSTDAETQVEANIDNNDAEAQANVIAASENKASEKNETVANEESIEIAEAEMPLAVFDTMSAAAPAGEIEMIDNGAVPMADAAAETEAEADYGWLVILAAALAAAGILFAVVARRRNREER